MHYLATIHSLRHRRQTDARL